ncbi:MAG: 8-oxo-dGTP diphosphatase MutT [Firmicutes bacterium HGW-Firmicutes-14]|nr:MAG: 8-oxo-dGTP diphosphatase MutT [Firmicutes bacterium HGW-Firmicutes-14]
METIVVTAAVIRKGDRFLIAQRKKGSHQEMKWEFPGGKVEQGEHPEDCLRREIKEELGVTVEVTDICQVVSHNYDARHIILLCYKCDLTQGEPETRDCHDYRWVTPAEMAGYEFAPADIPVVEKLRGEAGEHRELI